MLFTKLHPCTNLNIDILPIFSHQVMTLLRDRIPKGILERLPEK